MRTGSGCSSVHLEFQCTGAEGQGADGEGQRGGEAEGRRGRDSWIPACPEHPWLIFQTGACSVSQVSCPGAQYVAQPGPEHREIFLFFYHPNAGSNLFFKSPRQWDLVTAVLANYYIVWGHGFHPFVISTSTPVGAHVANDFLVSQLYHQLSNEGLGYYTDKASSQSGKGQWRASKMAELVKTLAT